jgi:ureidoglycolate lyase
VTLTRTVTAERITEADFAPFGRLLDTPGTLTRRDFAASVVNARARARANLALVRAPLAVPGVEVREMERHAFSTQAFFPLDVPRYLVVVAPDDGAGAPMAACARAFLVPGTCGISYDIGVWHCGMTALAGAKLFALLVFEDGSCDDTHVLPVEPFRVTWKESQAGAAAAPSAE